MVLVDNSIYMFVIYLLHILNHWSWHMKTTASASLIKMKLQVLWILMVAVMLDNVIPVLTYLLNIPFGLFWHMMMTIWFILTYDDDHMRFIYQMTIKFNGFWWYGHGV